MSVSQQVPRLQVSSGSALMWHDEAVSTINDEGPSSNGPSPQHVSPVDVGSHRSPVDDDNSVTLALAPTNRLPSLGGDLNAEGIESRAPLAPAGVALDLNTLARNKNIVAIEESIRILSDMVDGEAAFPQRTNHNALNFLADVEAALALLTGPV
jgi:hypothetical protein